MKVAGSRWRVEETSQSATGLAGVDEHRLRRYTYWSRWAALAMLSYAFLAVVRADEGARHPVPDDLIPLSCGEIARLSHHAHRPAHPRHGPQARLVPLVTPPPGPVPSKPLPPPGCRPSVIMGRMLSTRGWPDLSSCISHPCWSSAASNWLARPSAAAKARWSWKSRVSTIRPSLMRRT